jgi:nitronate monooxygenase
MTLRTRLTERLGIEYPIMSAPMAMHSSGRLAAAVSRAGGLGSFGGIHRTEGPDWVRRQVQFVRAQTERPFGIGFISAFIPLYEKHFEAALEERVPVVALSFGDCQPWLGKAKAADALVMCQVQTMASARAAVDGGADILVAQGNEAGGHTGTMNLLPLLVSLIDAFPDVPVLAAGGIASGRALAAVLAAGGDGAWVGTGFLATHECTEVTDEYKRLIVASDGEDTVFTRAYDIVGGAPWPKGIGERVRRNAFTDEWQNRDDEVLAKRKEIAAELANSEDPARSAILFGQSAGAIHAIRPAAEVVHEISSEAERILRGQIARLLS